LQLIVALFVKVFACICLSKYIDYMIYSNFERRAIEGLLLGARVFDKGDLEQYLIFAHVFS